MTQTIRLTLLVLATITVQTVNAYTDSEITNRVIRSTRYRHSREANITFEEAVRMCGSDTNRFVSLLQSIAVSHTNLAESMIVRIGKLGDSAALPFLYGCVTNAATGTEAIRAVFRIEGVTTNSVDQLVRYLEMPMTNVPLIKLGERTRCCNWIVNNFIANADTGANRYFIDKLIRFANGEFWMYAWDLDSLIIRVDGRYKYSKRRLSMLRSSLDFEIEDSSVRTMQRNYVTNAINELIAYPEANLND